MKVRELERVLVAAGIRQDAYDLRGGLPAERYCIQRVGRGWEVYYSEHGVKSELKVFASESDAVEYFLRFILEDPSTRNTWATTD